MLYTSFTMEKVLGVLGEKNAEIPLMKKVIQSCRGQIDGIIIVDSSDRPETKKEIKQIETEFAGFVTVIWNSKDNGNGAALSQGSRLAVERGATWVLILTDDAVPPQNMIATMLEAYHALTPEEQRSIGIITPNLMSIRGLAFPDGEPIVNSDGGTGECQLIKTTVFPAVGYWNAGLFMDCIDGEFCLRVERGGLKTLRVPRAIVQARYGSRPVMRHLLWKMVMVPNYRPYRYYYMSRNLVYLYIRNFRSYTLRNRHWYAIFWAVIIPRFFIKMLLFDTDRKAKIRACFRGWWDGIRGRLGPMPE